MITKNRLKRFLSLTGFTLIELLMVVGLIGIVSFLAFPYFKSFFQYSTLKKDTWQLLSDLRSYRQLAIIEHFNYRFVFNTVANSYTIEQHNATTDAYIKTVGTFTMDSDLVSATDTTFRPKGETSQNSTIVINGKKPTDTSTITVYATTGLAKVVTN